jgi:RHS repeat-associated protein
MLINEYSHQPGWYTWNLGYGYDALGNLASQSYPTGLNIDYAPNALGQATRAGAYATGAQYYPNGAIKQFTYGNGIVHTMTQNARQLPERMISSGGVLDYQHYYDRSGNIEHIANNLVAGWDPRDRWMQYDGLDRLTAAGSGSFGGDHWHRFSYDALDNIKSWKLAGVKDYADYVYDANNRLTNIRNTAGATVVGLSYDAQGNLQNKNGQWYEFDYGNRLRGVSAKEYYRYDGHGRRVLNWRYPTAATPNGTLSLSQYSQSGQLMMQWDDQYPKYSENIYLAGSVVAIRDIAHPTGAVTVKYQHTDALGSPVAVTDQAGAVIERSDYEPYGAIIGQPNKNGIGYTGHMMDGATGLTYMQQRYYDPSVGRFLSVDPVTADSGTGGNFNRYWYARNNPYSYTDPDGRWPSKWGLYVHQESIERVIGPHVTAHQLEILKQTQVAADAARFQTGANSFRHAMRNANQTPQQAREMANNFVRAQFERAWNAPTREQALAAFGIALHTLQDATSPAHAGFQLWTGNETKRQEIAHVKREAYDPGTNSELDRVTQQAWGWFESGKLPDGDLFNQPANTGRQQTRASQVRGSTRIRSAAERRSQR